MTAYQFVAHRLRMLSKHDSTIRRLDTRIADARRFGEIEYAERLEKDLRDYLQDIVQKTLDLNTLANG